MNTKNVGNVDTNALRKSSLFYLYKTIFSYLIKYYKLSLPLTIFTLIMIAYTAIIPLITKEIFDNALAHNDIHLFVILLSILMSGLLFLIILWIVTDILQSIIGVKISNDLRLRMFEKIHYLTMRNYRQNIPGNLLSRSENCIILNYVLTQVFWGAIGSLLFVVLAGCIMLYLNWQISLLVFTIMPLTFFIANKISVMAEHQSTIKEQDEAIIFAMMREDIDYHALITLLRLKRFRINQFDQKLHSFENKDFLYNIFLLLTNTAIASGIVFLQLSIIALGSYWVFTNKLTIGSFIAFLTIFSTFSYSMNALGQFYPALIKASHGLASIQELLEFPTHYEQKKLLPHLDRLTRNIKFTHVNFGYLSEQMILNDITFEILIGESVAIIGVSGSGKSTILDLLLRQEMPDSGTIKYDGKNIWEYSEYSCLSHIGIVPRLPCLFLMSISDNIRMGKLEATQEEIIAAAKSAEIHDEIIKLPEGYNTMVLEGGSNLSTGQIQRIVLARALVSNPSILILDEATSSLDASNQNAIHATLLKQASCRTTVMITHNLKEAISFKKIIFLDKGRIIETGNHNELMKAKGAYYKLWKKQSGVNISNDMSHVEIKSSWIKKVPLLNNIGSELLNTLADKFMIEEVPTDQIVFEQGSIGEKFYIIVKGSVAISKYDNIMNQQKDVAVLEEGDFFGEIALLHTMPRTARVKTLENCIFLVLHQKQFVNVFNKLPIETRDKLHIIAKKRLKN